ncbi:MAG: DUF5652 family protein [Patescibacteria group bacterium]
MMYSTFGYGHMYGSPWGYGFGPGMILLGILAAVFFALVIALKGYALWHAAKRDEKWWFIALLILNTAGILEAVYIIFFVKEWHKKRNNHASYSHTEHHGDHPHTPAQ